MPQGSMVNAVFYPTTRYLVVKKILPSQAWRCGKFAGRPGWFVQQVVKLNAPYVVDTPVIVVLDSEIVNSLLNDGVSGMAHLANQDYCTWHDFASSALLLCGIKTVLSAVSSTTYSTRARRPKNSVLATSNENL